MHFRDANPRGRMRIMTTRKDEVLDGISAATKRYNRAAEALDAARTELAALIVTALIDMYPDVRMSEVEDRTPYKREQVRRIRDDEWHRVRPDQPMPWARDETKRKTTAD